MGPPHSAEARQDLRVEFFSADAFSAQRFQFRAASLLFRRKEKHKSEGGHLLKEKSFSNED
jgi:hypothetical protein